MSRFKRQKVPAAYKREILVTLKKSIEMDIQTSKIELVKMILNINNERFIKKVTDFIIEEKSDFWNDLSNEEQAEIKKGIEQLNQGKKILFKDVLKKLPWGKFFFPN